ncbi:FKBP-type peptidyl-prolyl cis-trans isomerase [Sphingomonas bacterium]|uniref:FKBP-type peptidyl-prolyl cis-trans isomerase n=1 Tax=Sphingomonas bacterium TaxID=1895847 RepID=UPI00157773E7|nr:FKBP-type peptidyl-prolyl cis-trans isomerase [Sphingomonas bacterium]
MTEVTAVPLRPVGKSGITALWIGIAVLIAAGIGGAYASTQKAVLTAMPPERFLAANGKRAGVKTTASGLEYEVLKKGEGATPTTADVAQVDYAGRLLNGTVFDASKPGQPVAMPVGQVVPGFAEALTLMPRNAKYRVWIPPQLAYGDREVGPIPANSVLVFDITLHDFMAMPQGMGQGMPPGL